MWGGWILFSLNKHETMAHGCLGAACHELPCCDLCVYTKGPRDRGSGWGGHFWGWIQGAECMGNHSCPAFRILLLHCWVNITWMGVLIYREQSLPAGCTRMFYIFISLYILAEYRVALGLKPSLCSWNSWFMSGPGHLCSVAGMQGISNTPPLHVPSTRKQVEQAPGWADKGPPMLPQQGREAECWECQRRKHKSILSFFLSICSSFFLCYLSHLPSPVVLHVLQALIWLSGPFELFCLIHPFWN